MLFKCLACIASHVLEVHLQAIQKNQSISRLSGLVSCAWFAGNSNSLAKLVEEIDQDCWDCILISMCQAMTPCCNRSSTGLMAAGVTPYILDDMTFAAGFFACQSSVILQSLRQLCHEHDG